MFDSNKQKFINLPTLTQIIHHYTSNQCNRTLRSICSMCYKNTDTQKTNTKTIITMISLINYMLL